MPNTNPLQGSVPAFAPPNLQCWHSPPSKSLHPLCPPPTGRRRSGSQSADRDGLSSAPVCCLRPPLQWASWRGRPQIGPCQTPNARPGRVTERVLTGSQNEAPNMPVESCWLKTEGKRKPIPDFGRLPMRRQGGCWAVFLFRAFSEAWACGGV